MESCVGSEHLEYINIKTNNVVSKLNIDGLSIAIGHSANTDFVHNIDKKDGYIIIKNNYSTSNPRIFACGDCIHSDTIIRYKQASVSASEGCICALEIASQLRNNP